MSLIIIPITFVLIFILVYEGKPSSLKEVYVKSTLLLSMAVVAITELLSLINGIDLFGILMGWLLLLISLFVLAWQRKLMILLVGKEILARLSTSLQNTFKESKLLSLAMLALIVLVGVQGIIYPPNNWDSLTYHMSRISHWVSQSSVSHFPTNNFRQLYQPPFAEYFILHISLLAKSDQFANWVQFFFWLSMVPILWLITESVITKKTTNIFMVGLILCLPEGILQASSTQNDIVLSFFLACSLYFTIKTFKVQNIKAQIFFAGLSIGLTLLTKGTAYLFLAPIGVYFAIASFKKLFQKQPQYIYGGILALILGLSLNFGHYYRNYKLISNPLGTDSKMYANQEMSSGILASSIAKNIGMHMGPFPLNRWYDKMLFWIHDIIQIPINTESTNFLNIPYSGAVTLPNHEDNAPNTLYFYLIVASLIAGLYLLIKRKEVAQNSFILTGILVFQFIIFCAYLKWQPWHTRLHMPLFYLSMPLVLGLVSTSDFLRVHSKKLFTLLLLVALFSVCFNFSRPFLSNSKTSAININSERYKKYFANNLLVYSEYKTIDSIITINKYSKIGLNLTGDSWEYPFFYKNFSEVRFPIHLYIKNPSNSLKQDTTGIECIISTERLDQEEKLYGKKRVNVCPYNQFIWLYK